MNNNITLAGELNPIGSLQDSTMAAGIQFCYMLKTEDGTIPIFDSQRAYGYREGVNVRTL